MEWLWSHPRTTLAIRYEKMLYNQKATYLRSEKRQGKDCNVVRLDPPQQQAGRPSVTIWVEKSSATVAAMESSGRFGFKSTWQYTRVDGKSFLPTQIEAEMRTPAPGKDNQVEKATTSLTFSNYRVNKGISDKVFQEQPKKTCRRGKDGATVWATRLKLDFT